MTSYNLLYFLYGASIMFHLMMALLFSYKRRASLNIYVSTLMLVTAAQYAKNLALIGDGCYDSALESLFSSSIDLFTMPLYAIVLIEACRPGWLNWWRASLLYLPFLVLMTVSLAYPEPLVFDVIHISSFVYGVVFLSWSLCEVPRFERTLMEEFSYEKYINFNWLRGIIVLFFCILLLWIYDSVNPSCENDAIYLIGSLVVWAVACFFFYRQARVISIVKAYESADSQSVVAPSEAEDEALASVATSLETDIDTDTDLSGTPTDEQSVQQKAAFAERMHLLFERDHVYLNPRLRSRSWLLFLAPIAHTYRNTSTSAATPRSTTLSTIIAYIMLSCFFTPPMTLLTPSPRSRASILCPLSAVHSSSVRARVR